MAGLLQPGGYNLSGDGEVPLPLGPFATSDAERFATALRATLAGTTPVN